ncbi:apolipoprotein D-like isoform X2 [Tachypleus tridentatus]|uniref:apolipoprotein D-like isoform X2 n=1 Tax=Tachypleus tridentatus TaxID=6853 RepID=UPI003FD2CD9C
MILFTTIIFLVLFQLDVTSGQTGCSSKHLVMQKFDSSKFSGKWYEIEKSFEFSDIGSSCVTWEIKNGEDSTYSAVGKGLGLLGNRLKVTGSLKTPNANEPGKMRMHYDGLPYIENYWVVNTDYDQFAITLSCLELIPNLVFRDVLTILSRKPSMDATLKGQIYDFLISNKIDQYALSPIDQEDCS